MKYFKNNVGILITFILVILLSQSRFFDFLMDTYLGRLLLITLICIVAYSNKIIGLVAVLIVIVAFNYNDVNIVRSYNFYEGFDVSGNNVPDNQMLKDKLKEKIKQKKLNTDNSNVSNVNENNITAREGFCMSDREVNMLRGKQSNSIPIYSNSRNQNDNVLPSEKSIFSDLFYSFQ